MALVKTEYGWVKFYSEVADKMLAWPKAERNEKLLNILNHWIGKDFINPMPSYIFAEITTPKTYPARAKKAEALAAYMGLINWPGDFSGVPGTYAGSAFLNSPSPTKELVEANWDLLEAAVKPDVLTNSDKFLDALNREFEQLDNLDRGKDKAEVTKFLGSINTDAFIPLDRNNRVELEENSAFTKKEIRNACKTALDYLNFIKKWHKEYPGVKPVVFNHTSWLKGLAAEGKSPAHVL